MAGLEKYICRCCGQEHEGWPALTLNSPLYYKSLSEEEKNEIAKLNSDFCLIVNGDQTDRFIRCTLTLKVIDHCDNLEYGLWVSLNEKSYQDYLDNYNNENHLTYYLGLLSNKIPDYDDTTTIPATVKTRTGNRRPEIIPHEDFDHKFVTDYYHGIPKVEAERRINEMVKSMMPYNN